MSEVKDSELLIKYYQALMGSTPSSIQALKPHASDRRIYRLLGDRSSIVGVVNDNRPENEAFIYLSRHFRSLGLPVPEVHFFSPDGKAYLLDDLGDTTLLDLLTTERSTTGLQFPKGAEDAYRHTLDFLPQFQITAARTLDFTRCYPESQFSPQALMFDMQAFSSELVARMLPSFDVTTLTPDFERLIGLLSQASSKYFLYRDFQSRNVMMLHGAPHFIDYQGGRRGPLQYDVVSMLYQASAQLSGETRNFLLEHYLKALMELEPISRDEFFKFYGGFIVGRMLQVLGVYGRQGIGNGKEYFRKSIPDALHTLRGELVSATLPVPLRTLTECVLRLVDASSKDIEL